MIKFVKNLLVIGAVAFCGYVSFTTVKIYNNQEAILFRSVPLPHDHAFTSDYPFEELFFETEDKARIHAILYKAKGPSKGLVLYFHGRSGNLAEYWSLFSEDFLKRDYDFLIMDYRTFGKSTGKLTHKNLLSDAEMVYEYASTLYPPSNIIIYGRSLGTGVATYVASKHKTKMLILETPYTSIVDLAPKNLPFLPKALVAFLVKYPLKTYHWIRSVTDPIEIFHGTKDAVIPYDNSIKLYFLAKEKTKVQLNTIPDGAHDSLSKHAEYQNRLDILLK